MPKCSLLARLGSLLEPGLEQSTALGDCRRVFVGFVPAAHVVPQLREPLEGVGAIDSTLHHVAHHVPRVHIQRRERRQRAPLQGRQVAPHQLDDVGELCVERRLVLLQRRHTSAGPKGSFRALRPHQLVDTQHHLPRPRRHPLGARPLRVVVHGSNRVVTDGHLHGRLEVAHPQLDVALAVTTGRVDRRVQLNTLALDAAHGSDLGRRVVVEVDVGDALEALVKVRLHGARILGIGQDLDELIIRQEEEAREGEALELEVVVQALLDLVQLRVGVLDVLQQRGALHNVHDARVCHDTSHDATPQGIHTLELATLRWHLPHDVLAAEDGL